MEKLLHEQMREWSNDPAPLTCVFAKLDAESDCDLLKALADEIERQYFPRPRFEDGEPVQFGGVALFHGNDFTIQKIIYYQDGSVTICDTHGNGHSYRQGGSVQRPATEVCDADGVEIKVGDTVWPIDNPKMNMIVDNLQRIYGHEVTANCEFEGEFYNFCLDRLTHREPDTLEKLRDDMVAALKESPDACFMNSEYADRLAALIERGA